MEATEICPTAIRKALQLTSDYWTELSSRHQWLDATLENFYQHPLFQHTYTDVASHSGKELAYDLRSALALVANGLFRVSELEAFRDLNFIHHLHHGIILAVRALRERVSYVAAEELTGITRAMALTYAFKVLGEEMRDPRQSFEYILDRLDLTPQQKTDLYHRSILNTQNRCKQLVLH